MGDLMDLDLYDLIGVAPTASLDEIKSAYRKKALSCHPDKNPDNPKANEIFIQLSEALKVLTDEKAKDAYDKVLKAKHQAKIRTSQLDEKRKKFKEDLDAREEEYNRSKNRGGKTDQQKLKEEIDRLQKEGSRLVEEEKEAIRRQIYEQLNAKNVKQTTPGECKIKIKWKPSKDDPENGGYSYNKLYVILSKYGDIEALVISPNKCRALVEFKESSAAELAVQCEIGLAENPLKLEGLWKKKESSKPPTPATLSATLHADYENTVLQNMKRAEERRRIIEQMKAEDEKDNI
ncbi:hypothetical protein HCN44_001972 [Aphidius gifuensis]|uniref:J domain-containing protein n=1 Tax=Aphidius gifuensis TaxID=684658 RepID=A0A834Y1T4_APHGI|nr:dnaJ homolog subfamily C member 17 [Aphidius gifuensis]KAF7996340.1 hypothetical protein HCN44_001972 [Aphidius gifuensis]